MSSRWRDALRDALGLRLALWYAVIFVASALALVALTYVLLSASLRRYDRDTIETALVQYARAYMIGGVPALAREIREGRSGRLAGAALRAHRRTGRGTGVLQHAAAVAALRPLAAATRRGSAASRRGPSSTPATAATSSRSRRSACPTARCCRSARAPTAAASCCSASAACCSSTSRWWWSSPWPAAPSSRGRACSRCARSPTRSAASSARDAPTRACRRPIPTTRSASWAGWSTRCSIASTASSPACAARSTTSRTTCARR